MVLDKSKKNKIMPHRTFIAINLPEPIKQKLLNYQCKWPEFPAKWTKKENLHFTLVFFNNLSDNQLITVSDIVKHVITKHRQFIINLSKICYGPIKKFPPRMIWALNDKNIYLENLRHDLYQSLENVGINFDKETRGIFHITLARIRQMELRNMELEEIPEINEDLELNFSVSTIELIESHLKKTGPDYNILASFNL